MYARIIPAYAGSTHKGELSLHRERDHPRIRGEHFDDGVEVVFVGGSSPHTRGAPDDERRAVGSQRIIPAYAGSTWMLGLLAGLRRDHPRIRGEHLTQAWSRTCRHGSSPHTRGARRRSKRSA